MKLNIHPSLFLYLLLVLTFSFQSCSDLTNDGTSANDDTSINDVEEVVNEEGLETKTKDKKHSEMSSQEHSDFVAKHAEHLHFVDDKMVEIKNEQIKKKDHFEVACSNGNASLERLYNNNDEIHLLSFTQNQDSTSFSTKHHFFWENKLIYQFYHHVVKDGDMYVVDDHKTFFKDGEMLKCLEKKYKYKKNESEPNDIPYELVDLDPASKLTKDLEQLLTLPEEEIKTYLCK